MTVDEALASLDAYGRALLRGGRFGPRHGKCFWVKRARGIAEIRPLFDTGLLEQGSVSRRKGNRRPHGRTAYRLNALGRAVREALFELDRAIPVRGAIRAGEEYVVAYGGPTKFTTPNSSTLVWLGDNFP